MSVTTTIRDLGVGKLRENLRELADSRITVGWQGPSGNARHPEARVSIREISTFHEFGTRTMPARPIVRITYDRHSSEFRDALKRSVSAMIDGRADLSQAIAAIGDFGVAKLREELDASKRWAAALAQSTIDAKGHDHPLIDTKAMYNAASWAQREAGPDGSIGAAIVRQGGER